VPGWLTSVIELAVGAGCLASAIATWRRRELRAYAVLLALAGATAVGHAIWALASG
jgi:hypothetical protein